MLETRDKLTVVKGIGEVSAKRFEKLGISDVNVTRKLKRIRVQYDLYAA